LEVMIAVAVLAITLSVLYGSQSQSLSLATEAKFNTNAAFLANRKIAEVEGGILELTDAEGDFDEEYPGYTWQIEVEDVDILEPEILADISDLKHVTLTILWENSPFSHILDFYILDRQ